MSEATTNAPREREGAGVLPDAARNGGDAPSTRSCVCCWRRQGMAALPPSVCVSDMRAARAGTITEQHTQTGAGALTVARRLSDATVVMRTY